MHDPAVVLGAAREELARLPAVLDALVGGLDAEGWRMRPAATEWAPVEIVCHLRDEEAEDFGARVQVILDGGAAFAPIDPERWAVERRYLEADGPAALAELRRRRAASLVSLGGLAPAGSPVSTSSPPGSPTIGCTWPSSPPRWRAPGPRAGRPCARRTPARSPTARDAHRPGGDAFHLAT